MVGRTISHYQVIEKLGEGGMGVVYKARDSHLDRLVALKLLPADKVADPERKRRFVREAKAASALNHPNIVHIYDIDESAGVHFMAMEYVEGKTLAEEIGPNGLDLDQALTYAVEMADALAAAHRAGIVHRDLKPANVMVEGAPSGPGPVKVLDFGLAKLTEAEPSDEEGPTQTLKATTQEGAILGTVAYMSPEQVEGKKLDARSDVFSFGAVLYEMLTGRRAFQGDSSISTMSAILRDQPAPPRKLRPDVPSELARVLERCFEKNRDLRYPSGVELHQDLTRCQARRAARKAGLRAVLGRPRVAVPAAILAAALLAFAAWFGVQSYRVRWARTQALPEISRLIDEEKYGAAYSLALQAEKRIPNDPILATLWPKMSRTISVQTNPAGADVYRKNYQTPEAAWEYAGRSPLTNIRIPRVSSRWKIEKKGFVTADRTAVVVFQSGVFTQFLSVNLDEEGKAPAGMVRVSPGDAPVSLDMPGFEDLPPVRLEDYWLDRYEVTNRQFKEFLDRGGYQNQGYWKHEFRQGGRVLTWAEAMALFRDTTGRPGPAGWEQGDYPRGQDDYPVGGVSWFEAAAYSEFAGKTLPTIYHWNKAAVTWTSSAVVPASNFGGQGPTRAGSHHGMSPYGTFDMAGNVKEWCWNGAASGKRYILGGAWDEPPYMFTDADARSPFDRSPTFGFRCAKYRSPGAVVRALTDPVPSPARDYSREKPVSDELFRAYRGLYSYDKTPLNAIVESVDDSEEHWKKEKITFAAAYGNERVIAYLFLPKKSAPPFQTVVYFPGSNVIQARSSAKALPYQLDFILKSGRALIYPVYKGTFERGDDLKSDYPNTTSSWRDHVIAWSKDLGRSIDYLETRPEIDRNKLAYFGFSWGGAMGAVMPAIETRIKACIFAVGGFYLQRALPEVDQMNFAPRVKQPVLMLNGRYDFFCPVETSQMPLLRLLGAPQEHKRHVLYDTAHSIPRNELIKETLDWLDRYLGGR